MGRGTARIESGLLKLASRRACFDGFFVTSGPFDFDVRLVSRAGESAVPLEGSHAPWGHVELSGSSVGVHIPDDPYAAEAALRLLYHLEAARRGGVLLHSSAVLIDGVVVAALGPSGSGKSTFAELMLRAGADLLSDEINAVFPSGTIEATPFRSTLRVPGIPADGRLAALLTLTQAPFERIRPVEAPQAIRALLSQVYRSPLEPLSQAEVFRRGGALVDAIGVHDLSFRKHPAAAEFMKQWVRDHQVDS